MSDKEKVAHKHKWFRTGAMDVGQMRCISCGVWGQEDAPQRTWVDLTDADIDQVSRSVSDVGYAYERALLAKFKEKNT